MMSIDLIQPNIIEGDTEYKVAQVQRYLYQLVDQLNWALNTFDNMTVEPEVKNATTQELYAELRPMLDRLYAPRKMVEDLGLRVVNGKLCVVREVT